MSDTLFPSGALLPGRLERHVQAIADACPTQTVRKFAVIAHEGKRLYCDGHVIIATAGVDLQNGYVGAWSDEGKVVTDGSAKLWGKWSNHPADPLVPLRKCELRGSFHTAYCRYFRDARRHARTRGRAVCPVFLGRLRVVCGCRQAGRVRADRKSAGIARKSRSSKTTCSITCPMRVRTNAR